MTNEAGVLALLGAPEVRDEADRVAAAAGVHVVHLSPGARISRKVWVSAVAVLLDAQTAGSAAAAGLPRRPDTFVLCAGGSAPDTATLTAALAVGARQVIEMPDRADELVRELSRAAETTPGERGRGALIAVLAGRGGAGASTLAAAVARAAQSAAQPAAQPALLVDLDPWSGGIDLLLGMESRPGLRWPDLAAAGGRLSWPALQEALPGEGRLRVVSGARSAHEPAPAAVDAVIGAASRGGATVVCDLPRRLTDTALVALAAADLVAVITCSDVRACAATAALGPVVAGYNPAVGLVVRGPSPGGLSAGDVAETVGLPVLAAMRPEPMLAEKLERGGLAPRPRSPLLSAARTLLALAARSPLEPGRVAV
ncbi:septum site-determining protein Ssd [Mycolicibacterium palauense]|uniref:septum site-determining protein Ssd n=1 Tax=Mycolicibacterium palauense TaxID=2034511 RepID=UPI00159BEAAC|nr:septum site-determining protein Ssd [Mycolicibacterium palauense]